ncbi:MAG TPA: YceI family protein [Lacipirellulaceae bacterium]|jgi:polyisoprenoid-binding protein YceI|nr:YceI family protein [Lacipirellulaceae bacterium]
MSTLARRLAFWSLLISLLAARSAPAADYYTIDPQHTSIVFSVAHSGFSYVYGMFREASGTYRIDKTNPSASKFRLNIEANSLFTNNEERDKHLRSADFFNVQQFPKITFETTNCNATQTQDGGVLYQLTGNLTIHGVPKPIEVNLRMLGEGQGPYKDHRTGFLCQMELKRSDFGMTPTLVDPKLVGDAVGVTVSFEGSLQDPSTVPRNP